MGIQDFYRKLRDPSAKHNEILGHFHRALLAFAQSPDFVKSHPSHDAMVNGQGVIDKYIHQDYGVFKVEDFSMSTENCGGVSSMIIFTFAGRLKLTYAYNEGMWERGVVLGMMEKTREILEMELLGREK